MRFFVGFLSILVSILIVVFAVIFLNFSILFENLIAVICFIVSALVFYYGIWNLNKFYKNKRFRYGGIQVKAKILNIHRTILSMKNAPEFILEVSYTHPLSRENHVIHVDSYDKNFDQNKGNRTHSVNILVDPKDPKSAQLIEGDV